MRALCLSGKLSVFHATKLDKTSCEEESDSGCPKKKKSKKKRTVFAGQGDTVVATSPRRRFLFDVALKSDPAGKDANHKAIN